MEENNEAHMWSWGNGSLLICEIGGTGSSPVLHTALSWRINTENSQETYAQQEYDYLHKQISYYKGELINYMNACKSLSVGMQRMSRKMESLKKKYDDLRFRMDSLEE